MIVTDHAPHSQEEKARGMQLAPFGIVGFETAFPLLYTKFVATGRWKLQFLLDKMTAKPAEVFGLETGRLQAGAAADIAIIDLEKEKRSESGRIPVEGTKYPFRRLEAERLAGAYDGRRQSGVVGIVKPFPEWT